MQSPGNPRGNQSSDEDQTVSGCSCETSCQLKQELEETKAQLKRQKSLEEIFINMEKETRQELDRLRNYTNVLQVEYEELKVAHIINEEKFTDELQAEKNKNELLQQELEQLRISYKVLSARNENDVPNAPLQEEIDKISAEINVEKKKTKILREELIKIHKVTQEYESKVIKVIQQASTLQRELENEIKSHAVSVSECLRISYNLKAEQEARQKMAEEITVLQQNALESERVFGRKLDELEIKLSVQVSLNLMLSSELKAEREALQKIKNRGDNHPPKEAEEPEEKQCKQQVIISPALALEPPKEAEEAENRCEQQATMSPALALESQGAAQGNFLGRRERPPSVWKKTRHFLGLRKPETWKRKSLVESEVPEEEQCEQQVTMSPALALEPPKKAEEAENRCEQQATMSPALALESQGAAQGNSLGRRERPPSVWRRTRHFVGLRKPETWKRKSLVETEVLEEEQCEQQATISPALALEPPKEAEEAENQCEQQATMSPALALESQGAAQGNFLGRRERPPSVWRRTRHKPESWKWRED